MRPIDMDALIKGIQELTGKNDVYLPISFINEFAENYIVDTAPRWIPCDERLPELKTKCLITYLSWSGSPVIDIDSYDYDGEDGWWTHMDKVIAWMPLPKPYAERKDNEGVLD